jgi:hypothetical protein
MPLEGYDLALELVDLRHAGRIGLPRIAEAYIAANHKLGDTGDASNSFERAYGGMYGGVSTGQVYGPWSSLRNQIQTILGNTANNVEAAGEVLLHIAAAYESTDNEAATALQTLWDDRDVDENDPRDTPLESDLPEPEFP